jgi:chaperonin GroES
MPNLKPISDKLVVEPMTEDEVTKAGIILPDTVNKERPEKGKVIAVGPGKLLDNGQRAAMEIKVGDIVVFKKYSPDEIKIEDKEYLVLSENDIMAIIE